MRNPAVLIRILVVSLMLLFNGSLTHAQVAKFDTTSGYLTIPQLTVGSNIYEQVRFLYQGSLDFNAIDFTIKYPSDAKTNAVFNGSIIYLGVVKVGDSVYSNLKFQNTQDLIFSLIDIQTPKPIESTSMANEADAPRVNLVELRRYLQDEHKKKYNSWDYNPNAYAFLDIDLDGDDDLFVAPIFYPVTGAYTIGNYGSMPGELWINNGGSFKLDAGNFISNMPEFNHPRKVITGDFNGDLYPDIIVADHGFDAAPFPGANLKIILSNANGRYDRKIIGKVGFHHGVSSGDFDNDGDIDIFSVGGPNAAGIYTNDGKGNFTQANLLTKYKNFGNQYFNTEAADVDGDGLTDIIVFGHANSGGSDNLVIYQGSDGFNSYKTATIPYVTGFGTINDVGITDINQDGVKDLIFVATGDNDTGNNFYYGNAIYGVLMTADRKAGVLINIYRDDTFKEMWVPSITVEDINGDGYDDIRSANTFYDMQFINNGKGGFGKRLGNVRLSRQ